MEEQTMELVRALTEDLDYGEGAIARDLYLRLRQSEDPHFMLVQAVYWVSNDNHQGQWSRAYKISSTHCSSYFPGVFENSDRLKSEDREFEEMYDICKTLLGC